MAKMKAGFIGFIPYGASETEYLEKLKSYSGLGYRGFELCEPLLKGDVSENLKLVQSFGMKPLTLGYMKAMGADVSVGSLIENAHKLGVNRVTSFVSVAALNRFGMRPEPATYDEVMREIEDYESVAKELAKEDIIFAFHNHDVELNISFRGVPILYLMMANSEHIKIELDCGWVKYAGKDPVAVIKDLGNRLCALHIKDMTPGTVEQKRPSGSVFMPRFTTPGTGILNMKECLEAGVELGLEWAVVEQDFQYNLTEKETLTAAYLNMKETGLVE